jgi:hypothetical protein
MLGVAAAAPAQHICHSSINLHSLIRISSFVSTQLLYSSRPRLGLLNASGDMSL